MIMSDMNSYNSVTRLKFFREIIVQSKYIYFFDPLLMSYVSTCM